MLRGIAFITLLSVCSCAPSAALRSVADTDRWTIARKPDTHQYFVAVKSDEDLDKALEKLGCTRKKCSIGHIANIYQIDSDVTTSSKKVPDAAK